MEVAEPVADEGEAEWFERGEHGRSRRGIVYLAEDGVDKAPGGLGFDQLPFKTLHIDLDDQRAAGLFARLSKQRGNGNSLDVFDADCRWPVFSSEE